MTDAGRQSVSQVMNRRTEPWLIWEGRAVWDLLSLWSGFPSDSVAKNHLQFRSCKRWWFNPWVRDIFWRRKWQPTPTLVFLPGEAHGQGACPATVHRVSQSQTWLKWLSMHPHVSLVISLRGGDLYVSISASFKIRHLEYTLHVTVGNYE